MRHLSGESIVASIMGFFTSATLNNGVLHWGLNFATSVAVGFLVGVLMEWYKRRQ